MVSAKQLADFGYKAFSSSMILLTLYGGYLCSVRGYRHFLNKQALKQLEQQEMNTAAVKD
ncbi:cytochrome c oxidase assembly protein COX14 [Varanus komodoensis]|uniref:Cytochrome c oxidase assembly factor COX14 n=1 Tax=Varanus komodoensis TaxID=61221 RepID=A0A8D2J7B3_VARKO|nr:cytochrome c oxidase assembly protein COX14 [Varanus komodoensis]XP_044277950.1 cytochrome c oxidase assembly protein COX14 [Varanus komodoensis]XP_044277951.1 cytochrome c oxidase assembly protein COX14 [Varanus komodoensis]XP_044277952.1 cytochrome c oxidase assembly protein COX14 [Varanus komodoensis]XP_044277953.1 cytochrome c oxidase assembly protein COX14 [Varanus komodoensis]